MRGNVNGAVLSLVLWAMLTWSVACAGVYLDNTWSSSAFSLLMSLACMICAMIATVIWMLHNGDAGLDAVAGSDSIAKSKDAGESADGPGRQAADTSPLAARTMSTAAHSSTARLPRS